jgi:hypothetical protein
MSKQGWVEGLITSQVDGAALVSSTSQTSILPAAARITLPANYFSEAGKTVRVTAAGRYGSGTASTGNISFFITLGTVASPINAWVSGALALATGTIAANCSWLMQVYLTVRAIGSGTSATLMGVGALNARFTLGNVALATNQGTYTALMPDTAPVVSAAGFDSTITNVLDLQAQFSVNSANQTILAHMLVVESLN